MAHAVGFAETVEHGRAAGDLPGPPPRILDLGTGAGIPGLVLATRWPAAAVTLLDAGEARTEALAALVASLGWAGRVQVVRARAEAAGRDPELRGRFPVAVARGFGAPPVLAECAAPFLELGGLLVVSEPPFQSRPDGTTPPPEGAEADPAPKSGPGAWDPTRWPEAGCAQVGLEPLGWFHHRFGYQLLRQGAPCPDRFPRREGIPAKRPLWA